MTTVLSGRKVTVRGTVQGVGFRPFIYHLAANLALNGWVKNTSSGVEIRVDGTPPDLERFLERIRSDLPPLASIDTLAWEVCPPGGYRSFEILASQPQPGDFQPVPPDIAICEDCRRELFAPSDRRYRYPFINCTNCGPRFSIIRDIPYDRPLTSMSGFALCPECSGEYQDPRDRRFHAQPVACPQCGPQIWYMEKGQQPGLPQDALHQARTALAQGKILAVKGLGGFHLACDASNPTAVETLRRRKKRSDKPFALMAYDLAAVWRHCVVTPEESELLCSRQAPVVILERLPGSPVAAQVAPGQVSLGVMLAYTPLHLLLCEPEAGFPDLLVMTSGNLSEEPIAFLDADAATRLAPLADAFLLHDRPIHIRIDDSVMVHTQGQPYFLRRSRGYAPQPTLLPRALPPLLAAGAELKNTFCLTRERYAFLSHHIGDLENLETLQSYEEGIAHYERLFKVKPQGLACDLHPNYLSTRYAEARARQENLPLVAVQHHHAHLAACLADNHWDSEDPVIGLCFDGTGLGSDGAIWGGEFLLGSYRGFERRFHLAYAPLPGGDLAVRKPARMALAHLRQASIDWDTDLPPAQQLCYDERTVIASQIQHQINTPMTSSMGRFFDAASALIGLRQTASYEGQAAIELEAICAPDEDGSYPFEIADGAADPAPLWAEMIADWRANLPLPILSARFHNSIARLALDLCIKIRTESSTRSVALSGGVWQNRVLLAKTTLLLREAGFQVLTHHQIPTNDGGIAIGQAFIAARTLYP